MTILKLSIGNANKIFQKLRFFLQNLKNILKRLKWKPKDFKIPSRVALLYESSSGNQVGGLPLVSVITRRAGILLF